jgi:hypothetical protein
MRVITVKIFERLFHRPLRIAVVCALVIFVAAIGGCDDKKEEAAEAVAPISEVLEKHTEKGPVKLTVKVSPKQPRLSDLLQLEVIVTAIPEIEVVPPVFGQSVGEFAILDYATQSSVTESGAKVRKFTYQLEPTQSGAHIIRSFNVEFTDKRPGASTEAQTIESEPLEVNIIAEAGDKTPSLTDLQAMSPPVKLPPTPLSRLKIALIAAGVLLLTGILVILLRRKRRTGEAMAPKKTPEEIAREELAELLAEDLPNKGMAKEFYVRLTGIVRRFIESTTGLRAPEQTTEEFLRDMRIKGVFDTTRAQRLADFLEAADMVKYAGMQPGQRQVEESIGRAQEFIGVSSALAPMPATAEALK